MYTYFILKQRLFFLSLSCYLAFVSNDVLIVWTVWCTKFSFEASLSTAEWTASSVPTDVFRSTARNSALKRDSWDDASSAVRAALSISMEQYRYDRDCRCDD